MPLQQYANPNKHNTPTIFIRISVGKKEVKNMTREPILLSFEKKSFKGNVLVCYGTPG
jgi:hypothetical protein